MGSITIPADMTDEILRAARISGLDADRIVIDAIREHLADLRDTEVAVRRLAEIQEGRADTVSLEEVLKQHGLGG